ncbi:ABC transporter ATP-binding protein [Woeseiaceae bacterium]|jgi:ABC-2 type transport system ATP-binding protein|nr:ABC transporter ATP-binding protein [Woeseiaceae bacterium]|tara:strand:- start:654 stop:1589 length:936 start_codon:yes stop_codon:yes gene_type:complete
MSALSIKNLTKTYANGFLALKGIDLEVDIGGFYSLLGPNGAGKTTAIRIVCSLVEKSAGNIEVFGYNLATHPEEAKMNIGMVPQEVNFNTFDTPLNILVNQAGFYGIKRSIALKRAKKYLGELKLWDKKDDISRNLSGGMKRRLMIARALIHEPELLILDEPTAGVDIEIRRSMWKFLKDTNANGTTIILTTHYLEEAENLCRNIAIIDEGVIIENTRMIDLLKQLKQETFVLSLENDLMNDSNLNEFSYTLIGGNQLEVLVDEDHSINDLFELLNRKKIKVSSLRNKSNRLEELFMRLVHSKNDTSKENS